MPDDRERAARRDRAEEFWGRKTPILPPDLVEFIESEVADLTRRLREHEAELESARRALRKAHALADNIFEDAPEEGPIEQWSKEITEICAAALGAPQEEKNGVE